MDHKSLTKKLSNLTLSIRRRRQQRPAITIPKDDHENVRKRVLEGLTGIYRTLKESDDVYVTVKSSNGFLIQYEDLILEEVDGPLTTSIPRFFQPCSSQFLKEHPISPESTEAMEETQSYERLWLSVHELRDYPLKGARFLCSWLALNFSEHWRVNGKEKASLEMDFTKWTPT